MVRIDGDLFNRIQKDLFRVLFELERENGFATYGDLLVKVKYNQEDSAYLSMAIKKNVELGIIEENFDVSTLMWRYKMANEARDYFRNEPTLGSVIRLLEKKENDGRVESIINEDYHEKYLKLKEELAQKIALIEKQERMIAILKDAVSKMSNGTNNDRLKDFFSETPEEMLRKSAPNKETKIELMQKVSDHWKKNIRYDNGGMVEWICPHGIGHYEDGSSHGCDGCCKRADFPGKKKE